MRRITILPLLIVLTLQLITINPVYGDHFEPAIDQGTSHSLLINSAFIDNDPLVSPDEIGVFTSGGICAGAKVIEDNPPYGMAAWADNPGTEEVEGFLVNEPFAFRMWDASEEREYEAHIQYRSGPRTWQYDGITLIERIFWIGQEVPVIQVSTDYIDFGEVGIDLTAERILTVENIGTGTLTIDNINVDDDGFDTDFGGEIALAPDESHDLRATFKPPDAGDYDATLTISCDDPDHEQVYVALTGAGIVDIEPNIALSEPEHDFGEWFIGYPISWVLRITNEGTDSLTVENIDIDEAVFSHNWNDEHFKLAPDETYRLTVTFAPEEETDYTGELTISSNDPDEDVLTVPLYGVGVEHTGHFVVYPRQWPNHPLLVSSTRLDGEPLETGDEIGVFTPAGHCGGALVITADENPAEGQLGFTAWADALDTDVIEGFRPGEEFSFRYWDISARVEIEAVPEYVEGPQEFEADGFTILRLTGQSSSHPSVSIAPLSIDFGDVPTNRTADASVRITNNGDAELRLSNIEPVDDDHFDTDFAVGFVLAPEESRNISVTFMPDDTLDFETFLQITSNSPGEEFVEIDLTGRGTMPPMTIEVNDTNHNFGPTNVNYTTSWDLIILNSGWEDLIVDSIRSDNEAFSTDFPDSPVTLERDDSDTVTVSFTPDNSGDFQGTLSIYSNDPENGLLEITLSGEGTDIPVIIVDPTELDFGAISVDQLLARRFTISNEGNADLIVSDMSIEGNYFHVNFDGELTLEPDQNRIIPVYFVPLDEGGFNGQVVIESNDPILSEVRVDLAARAEMPAQDIMLTYTADEDYVLPEFEHYSIDDHFDGARHALAVDIDGDSDIDVIGAASYEDEIAWWENDGGQEFEKHTISDEFPGASRLHYEDVDSDGDVDILGVAGDGEQISWWENDGDGGFDEHLIDDRFTTPSSVYAVDMDNDYDIDIVGSDFSDDRIWWWENDGLCGFTRHSVVDGFDGAYAAEPVDLDDDGDMDMVASGYAANQVAWFENDGNQDFTLHVIAYDFSSARSVHAVDLDYDDDIDIIGAASEDDEIVWFENDGEQNFNEHVLIGDFDAPRSAWSADLNADGDIDVIAAAFLADRIVWLENEDEEDFTPHDISLGFNSPTSVYTADIDDDGDYDILAASNNDGISWWDNQFQVEHDFGEIQVNDSDTWTFIIVNLGRLRLSVSDITSNSDVFSTDFGEQIDLDPGETAEIEVLFTPDDGLVYNGVLIIVSDDPDEENVTVPLTGEGRFPNRPPDVVEPLEDIVLSEDFDPYIAADLNAVFNDPDGDTLSFSAVSDTSAFIAEIMDDSLLWFDSADDWNGEAVVIITADDNYEEGRDRSSVRTLRLISYTGNANRRSPARDYSTDEDVNIEVTAVNDQPIWMDIPGNIAVDEGVRIQFPVAGEDVDGDNLTILYTVPDDAEFTDNGDGTGDFDWQTDNEDAGNYTVILVLTDGELTDSAGIYISVGDVNRPPQWDDVPKSERGSEGARLEFSVTGSDPDDDDTLTVSAASNDLPGGWDFNDNGDGSGRFSWTPDYEDSGSYTLTVTIADSQFSIDAEIHIRINHVNRAPVWEDVPESVEVNETELLEFTVRAADPDGDEVELGASSDDLPGGWQFSDNGDGTGAFSWTPGFEDADDYNLTVTVTDGEHETSENIVVTVHNRNRAPSWDDIPYEIRVDENDLILDVFSGSDPDVDDLTISFEPDMLPDEFEFTDNGNGTCRIRWQTTYEDQGGYIPVFTISDGDLFEEVEVFIIVDNINRTPVWTQIPVAVVVEKDSLLEIELVGEDPDGDRLTISYEMDDLPDGPEISDNGDGSALFRWTPSPDDAGMYNVTFILSDDEFDIERDVRIRVNQPPHWTLFPDPISIDEAEFIHFTIEGIDPDNDYLTISIDRDGLPEAAQFTDHGLGIGTFDWQTNFADAEIYLVVFILFDGYTRVPLEIEIRVNNVNHPPFWVEIPDAVHAENEGDLIEFDVIGVDPDQGDAPYIHVTSLDLPDGWEFTEHGIGVGTFTWQTGAGDEGGYTATFRLTDQELNVIRDVIITVGDVNRPPVWEELPDDITVDEGTLIEFSLAGGDPEDDDLTITLDCDRELPDEAEFTDYGDGTGDFSWQTGAIDAGDYELTLTLSDGQYVMDAVVRISINDVNMPPEWVRTPGDITQSEAELIQFLVNGVDPDGDDVTVTVDDDGLPDDVIFDDIGDGRVIFSWQTDYEDAGEYYAIFTVSDAEFDVDTTINITVVNVNRLPVWEEIPESERGSEGARLAFNVQASDPDVGDPISISASSDDMPDGWSLDDNGNGSATFNWTPSYDDAGGYTLTIFASDGVDSITADVEITVDNVNRPPVWDEAPGMVIIPEDVELIFTVEASDPDGDEISLDASSDDLPDGWEFTDNGDGTGMFVWTPGYADSGEYTASVTASDGEYDTRTDVTIRVRSINRSPVWEDVPESEQGSEGARITFSVQASDPDGEDLDLTAFSDNLPDGWEFTDWDDGTGQFVWQPGFYDAGEYILVLTASDGDIAVDTSVVITVIDDNLPPRWIEVPDSVEGDENEELIFTVEADDPDGDDLTLSASSDDLPDGWRFTDNGDNSALFNWTPGFEDAGRYSLTLTASDDEFNVDTNVVITIYNVNRQPIWVDVPDSVFCYENDELAIVVEGSDPDGDKIELYAYSEVIPEGWEFNDNGASLGTFNWTPGYDDSGDYILTVTVSDGEFEVDTSIVITVIHVNRPPVWDEVPRSLLVNEGALLSFDVSGSDPDNDSLTITASSDDLPEGFYYEDNHDGTADFNWTPGYEDAGEYTVTVTLSDGEYDARADVLIVVHDVNRAPVWDVIPDQVETGEAEELIFGVEASDPDSDDITFRWQSGDLPPGWDFTVDSDSTGTFTWTPGYDDDGEYTLTLTVSDAEFDVAEDVVIVVFNTNRPPIWNSVPRSVLVNEDAELTFAVTGSDPDEEDEVILSAASYELPPGGWEFTDNGDGTGGFRWTPTYEDSGSYNLILTISDGDIGVDATVGINVHNVNRAPVWVDVPESVRVSEGARIEFNVEGSDPDGDDMIIFFDQRDLPGHPEFTDNEDGSGHLIWNPTYDDAGDYTVQFMISDGYAETSIEVPIRVWNVNRAPVWTSFPDPITVDEGEAVDFVIRGSDPDGDELSIEFDREDWSDAARFTDVGEGNGVFAWQTTFDDAGEYIARFILSDGDIETELEIEIEVRDVNRPPVWIYIPEQVVGDEATSVEFVVSAVDPDGDTLTIAFTSDDLPEAVQFTDNGDGTGTLHWETTYEDSGRYTATFTASDDEFNTLARVPITINDVNRPPVWTNVPEDREAGETEVIEFTIGGMDRESDRMTLTLNMDDLPEAVEFTDNGDGSGDFHWETSYEDSGSYRLEFTLADYQYETVTHVGVRIINVNRPPYWTDIPDIVNGGEGTAIEFEITGRDDDDDDLTISMQSDDLPDAATLRYGGDGSATFAWLPGFEDAGTYHATFSLADWEADIEADVIINVEHINRTPVWTELPELVKVNEGNTLNLHISGVDPDRDELTITYESYDIPDDADFTDRGDGTGELIWETGFDDEGTYSALFILNDGDIEVGGEVVVRVEDVDDPPYWVDVPRLVQADEAALIQFDVTGVDPEESEVELLYESDDLPNWVDFEDHGDGRGTFIWRTDYTDAGEYSATFTISDDLHEGVTSVVPIVIRNVNRAPEWEDVPESERVSEGARIEFNVEGSDPDMDDRLTITFYPNFLPDAAEFTDNGDGSGSFAWQTGFFDAGEYPVNLILSDGTIDAEAEILITVNNVNREPYWTSYLGVWQPMEGECFEFTIAAEDPDGDDLTLEMSSDDLPEEALFVDNGDGTGDFTWQTGYQDAWDYHAIFSVSDGEAVLDSACYIEVLNIQCSPVWTVYPLNQTVTGYIDNEISVYLEAVDPDSTEIDYSYNEDDLPGDLDVQFEPEGNGVRFTMHPDRFQHGNYNVGFTADDGNRRTELEIEFIVLPYHYLYTNSGRGHEIQINGLDHFGDELEQRDEPNEYDGIGVITPDGVVAGAYRFSDNVDMPLTLTAWGDNPNTQELDEGFAPNEPFRFVYWDHTVGEEFDMNVEYISDEQTWRLDGFSLVELFAGPALSFDVDSLDFGTVRIGFDLETSFTITNTGTAPIENLTWEGVEGSIFQIQDPPELLGIGEQFEAPVSFVPDEIGDYNAQLTARTGDGDLVATLELIGSGVAMDHFIYQRFFGQASHEISVLQADIGGQPLEVQDEIGAFTPAGVCAGAVYGGEDGYYGLIAWGDDPDTGEIEGFQPGEAISFRFWDRSASQEITVVVDWRYGCETWQYDGRSQVVLSTDDDHFTPIVTDRIHHVEIIYVDIFGEAIRFDDEVAAITPLGMCAGSVSGINGESANLEAYGDDPETPGFIEGFLTGELIYFRIWDSSAETEYAVRVDWLESQNRWEIECESRAYLSAVRDNVAPAFRPLCEMTTNEGDNLGFVLVASDMDNDPVSIYMPVENIPRGIILTDDGDGRAAFNWMPSFDQAGRYTLRFGAFDGIDETLMEVPVRVQNVNRPPVLARIDVPTVNEGERLVVQLQADDPDGDEFDFNSVDNMPFGASLTGNLFTWIPNYAQAGIYEDITIRVTDFGQPALYDEEIISITVQDVNRPPMWERGSELARERGSELARERVSEGAMISFTLSASDPDGDNVRMDGDDMPEDAEFREVEDGVGIFTWQTNYESAGDYLILFSASDDDLADTLLLDLQVMNVNRLPILDDINDVEITVGSGTEFEVTASDPDPEDRLNLELTVTNPPPGLEINQPGNTRWTVTWEPERAGVYSNVRFLVSDLDGGYDDRYVVFTALQEDYAPPVIAGLFPENKQVLRIARPTIRADVFDEGVGIDSIAFVFEDEICEDFAYNSDTYRLNWTPEADLNDGSHGYTIRAFDRVGNVSTETVLFEVVTEPGEIELDDLLMYTAYDRIDIGGEAQPFQELELWRSGELLMETGADHQGRFEFMRVSLVEGRNSATVSGHDDRSHVTFDIYLDTEPPVVELMSPDEFENDPAPRIRAVIRDEGIGVDENGVHLALDGEEIDDFLFRGNTLVYAIPEQLEEGEHRVSLSAADMLGNAPVDSPDYQVFIDSYAPQPVHSYFNPPVDTIGNRQPEIHIPIDDPLPSSGIVGGDIVLSVDGEELDYEWDEVENAVLFDFDWVDPLVEGSHDIFLEVYDRAGNYTLSRGRFIVGDIEDSEPPEFSNLTPPPGCVAGSGGNGQDMIPVRISADTVSFVVSDNDAGVDWETVWMRVIALNDPDDPADNDTTVFDEHDLIFQVPPGRILLPALEQPRGQDRAPAQMRGLQEGVNQVEAFADDEAGNTGSADWRFFLDLTPPEAPVLDDPDIVWTNNSVITLTGSTGGDEPVYAEGYTNNTSVRIYRNGELTAEVYAEPDADFEASEVLLVDGLNRIDAAVADGGGNESELSDPFEIRLDLISPEITDFELPRGPNISDLTPEFPALLSDEGSGLDEDGITFTIDDREISFEYNPENGAFLGSVRNHLEEGEHTAVLHVTDLAGNEAYAEYAFWIILPPVATPEFNLNRYTSINRVSLTGRTEEIDNIDVVVILNGRAVGSVPVEDHAFSLKRDAAELPDTSWVTCVAFNPAGVFSDTAQAQMLLHDRTPPVFSHASPAHGTIVDVEDMETVSILMNDLEAGIRDLAFSLIVPGKAQNFRTTVTDSGFWLFADVAEVDFINNETISAIAAASDQAVIPNPGQYRWQFVTRVRTEPVILLPDTSFDEDEQVALNLHDFINDPDNSWYELEITAEFITGDDHAALDVDTLGILQLSPDADWFGRLLLAVYATDPDEQTGVDTALVEINAVNDPPRFDEIEDAGAWVGNQFEKQVGATDTDDDDLVFSDDCDLFDISQAGLILFTPVDDMRGRHEVVCEVHDATGASDQARFTLYIEPVNNPVELIADIPDIEIDEDSESLALADLDTVFTDADNRPLNWSFDLSGEGILVEVDPAANILFIEPEPDFFGEVHVIIYAEDRAGSEAEDDFTVTVLSVNDPPRQIGTLPSDITLEEDPERLVIADLDSIFIDPEQQDISFGVYGGNRLGVEVDDEKVLSINPTQDWWGEQSFFVVADDGVQGPRGPVRQSVDDGSFSFTQLRISDKEPRRDESQPIEISVEVVSINDPPRPTQPVEDQEFDEDSSPWSIDLSQLFTEVDGEAFDLWADAAEPLEAQLSQAGLLTLLAPENYNGSGLQVVVTALDETGLTGSDTFYVDVLPVNDPPEVISSIGEREFVEDTGPWTVADLDDIFRDIDGDLLDYNLSLDDPIDLDWWVNLENELIVSVPVNFCGADIAVTVTADDRHNSHVTRSVARASFSTARTLRRITTSAPESHPHASECPPAPLNVIPSEGGGPVRQLRSISGGSDRNSWLTFGKDSQRETGLRRDDTVEDLFMLTVTPVNDRPLWIDVISDVEATEGARISVALTASDVDLEYEGDQLTLSIADDEGIQAHNAILTDHGDGSGTLTWQTDRECAGDYFTVFQVEDRAGEVDWWTVRFIIGDVNRPVQLVRDLPDTTFAEDAAGQLICRLRDYFSDPDGDSIAFSCIDPEGLTARVVKATQLYLQPEPNWHGDAYVVVTASDGVTSVNDTMLVTIQPVNDSPTAFDLSQPADSVFRYSYPAVLFSWQESVDIVEDSTVTYSLVLEFDGEEHYYRGMTDTSKWVPRTDFVIDVDQPTEVRWWVYASDGTDSIRSISVNMVTIASIRRHQQEDVFIPTELALGRAFPNPFNDVMTVLYDLPEPTDVSITIHDANGRLVDTILDDYIGVGRYPAYWDGWSRDGRRASSGLYIVRLKTSHGSKMRKVMLLR